MDINEVHKSLRYASIALFADDTALSYWSPTDLKNIACWLEENKLTFNTSKSKFMLIANSKKLKNVSHFMLTVNNRTLKKESTLQYLGIVINDSATKKVNQRLGVLRRIKHLLPIYARNLYVVPRYYRFLITATFSLVIRII